jgi:epoxyqueuosine reductase
MREFVSGLIMPTLTNIANAVKAAALDAGFELAGVASIGSCEELEHYPEWIAKGYAGDMKYLERRDAEGRLKRASLQHVAPWARSVVVCAINYNTAEPYSNARSDPERGWISRYAWSREDYHEAVLRKLRIVEAKLRSFAVESRTATNGDIERVDISGTGPSDEFRSMCYVDTGPLVERVYAKYAGVGWIGKNTCIINQKMGSWLFLAVILTSMELEPDLPAPDRCGTCTRCIDACPTNAFVGPHELDASRCISYLTIEKRGSIPEDLREDMGRHVFGCDICQDVCPWNRKAPATNAPEFQARDRLVNPALDWLAELKTDEFRETFRGSPVKRAKLQGLRRNALIATGNSGERKFIPILEKLLADEDNVIVEAAGWAMEKLKSS